MNTQHCKIFDSHFHIIDPRFPLVPNNGYLPPPFTCSDYHSRMANYQLAGGAIVSGSFQAFDQQYLLDALKQLGPQFVGVTQLPITVSDDELTQLHAAGVRAVRFNIARGGSEDIRHINRMAQRVFALAKWHVELYIKACALDELYPTLAGLPAICIDHLGLTSEGYDTLLKLVERGAHVKACGFGRVDFDVKPALQQIHAINPSALMFGTDLPCTRAPRPFYDNDCLIVLDTLGETAAARVFYDNACDFYLSKR